MKKTVIAISAGVAILFSVPAISATDYSSYTLQELAQMRGTLADKSQEERQAFRDAWRAKMQSASPEERAAYSRGRGRGYRGGYDGDTGSYGGRGNGSCDGSGRGKGRGRGQGRYW